MHIPLSLMSGRSRFARIIGLLGLAAALAACSSIKLGYNTLDDVAYWWLDSYVDFSDDQSPLIRQDLDRLQLWHRSQELPRFAGILSRLEELAPGEVSPAQACAVVGQIRERLEAVAQQAEPAIVTLAMGLAPEQLANLERKYGENNAKYRKEWVRLPAAELRDKRFKEFLERSETFYGTLGEPQRAVLRRQLEQSAFDPARTLAERQRRQQDALQILRKMAGTSISLSDARNLVRGYVRRLQEPPDAAQRSFQQAMTDESCKTFSALHASTSPSQREAAARRLRAYQKDVRELAAQQ